MSGLKVIKNRIKGVQTTHKITSAMKMISVGKLRAAHYNLMRGFTYADEMNRIVRRLVRSVAARQEELSAVDDEKIIPIPPLLKGKDNPKLHMIVVVMSDEGLCGHFNQQLLSMTERVVDIMNAESKENFILCLGVRGSDLVKRKHPDWHVRSVPRFRDKKKTPFIEAETMTASLIDGFYKNYFDTCTIVYTAFESAAIQRIVVEELVPIDKFNHTHKWVELMQSNNPDYIKTDAFGRRKMTLGQSALFGAIGGAMIKSPLGAINADNLLNTSTRSAHMYDYETSDDAMLEWVLPQYIESYIYRVLLDTAASESASRLLAMDNASTNAQEILENLHMSYHKKRQESVTTGLIEMAFTGEV